MVGETKVLDHGFARLVEAWGGGDFGEGFEAGIIEAARQSTQGTFRGWERDFQLLKYMYDHNHATPFEFAGMVLEVRAPIFIFRQWHRHRLFSVNEMSGRYGAVPSLFYLPSIIRVMDGAKPTDNRQASGSGARLTAAAALAYIDRLERRCYGFKAEYETDLKRGIPNELARLGMPVNWYSQMRVGCNLRGWLHYLGLRLDPHAQWEHQEYAREVMSIVRQTFPKTASLFEGTNEDNDRPSRGSSDD